MAGVSAEVSVSCGGLAFRENILFTHEGLSGPAALQASLYWRPGEPVTVDLIPDIALPEAWFLEKKEQGARAAIKTLLAELIPKRLAERFCEVHLKEAPALAHISKSALEAFCKELKGWRFVPARTVGYSKAEVTRGGVSTAELSSKTMESKKVPGLYFIGEVVDVTGRLGGYNLQWAWSSGWAAGQAV